MLKKVLLNNLINNNIALRSSLNFIKIANFSRKITNQDKNLDKIEVIKTQQQTKSLKPKHSPKNYIDIEQIKDLSDPNLNVNRNPAKTKDVAKNDLEENLKDKNINIIKEQVTVKIKPYFPNAVSEREKSHTHIDSSKTTTGKKGKKDSGVKDSNSLEILKNKRVDKKKIAAARKATLFMQNVKRELPDEFYRMGLTSEIMDQHSELVKRAMSLNNASIEEFHKARMLHVRKLFARHERDTASPAITACALCEKIIRLITHIKKCKKDMTAFINLQKFLTKRRRYMLYLKRTDFNAYSYIIKYYGMKDFDDSMHKKFKTMPMMCKTTYERTKKVIL